MTTWPQPRSWVTLYIMLPLLRRLAAIPAGFRLLIKASWLLNIATSEATEIKWNTPECQRVSPSLTVLSGPFKGIRYRLPIACGSMLLPKLVGTYENELHAIMENLITEQWHTVLDIGTAEGYYAVGLAHRLPQANVIGIDISKYALSVCRDIAKLNGVKNIRFADTISAVDLDELISQGPTLIICDCEGAEVDILNPAEASSLRTATMLIETHDMKREGCSEILWNRFIETHDITRIDAREKNPEESLVEDEIKKVLTFNDVDERRPAGMFWYFMRPRRIDSAPAVQ